MILIPNVMHRREDLIIELGVLVINNSPQLYFGLATEKGLTGYLSCLEIGEPITINKYKVFYFPKNPIVFNKLKSSLLGADETTNAPSNTNSNDCSNPKSLTSVELANKIYGKKVLLFTGAGISVKAGIPDMNKLEILMQEIFNETEEFIVDVINGEVSNRLGKLTILNQLFMLSEPSVTHWNITSIVNQFGYNLLTGNFDGLHEKTGIFPFIYTNANQDVTSLEQYDFILTIGLSDEGMLGLADKYRELNPNGIIVAINFEVPAYLKECDYLIRGDCEEETTTILARLKVIQTSG